MPVLQRQFTIGNKLGLHARAAAKIVKIANQYRSHIRFLKNGQEADAKSILGILTLACPQGCIIEVHVEGDDALEAMDALTSLFESNFGEE
ncbi:MAG: HPr family phosphocarrier protein [Deltaproteobacteria bacterium]|nr:HPr family phosphocarrier protein [Deltaproteobacteria bacterium]MBW2070934.1 HPr family phosphocarrier protein [Deltaproteobacteria bacterium]